MLQSRIHAVAGNRLEALADRLADHLASREGLPADPFAPQVLVVHGRGMERYVAMRMARRSGVFARVDSHHPMALPYELFPLVLPDLPRRHDWDVAVLPWRIARLLPDLAFGGAGGPGFGPVRAYLGAGGVGDGEDDVRLVQLSRQLARLYDTYLGYRPEMIRAWETGADDRAWTGDSPHAVWQAALWRALCADTAHKHRVGLMEDFFATLKSDSGMAARLPSSVSLFGISALPPFYIAFFRALSAHVPVHVYMLSPSREFWADEQSPRREARERLREAVARSDAKRKGAAGGQAQLGLFDLPDVGGGDMPGNKLLASLGTAGRNLFEALAGDMDMGGSKPDVTGLLSSIQFLLFRGMEPSAGGERLPAFSDDDSIRIHACHGPMREMEVLRDQLLDLLESDPTLQPDDIVVMCPDIEAYAPYIDAVFDVPPGPGRIPYGVADRSLGASHHAGRVLLALFDLAAGGGRLPVSRVMTLLDEDPVRRCFGLEREDVALAREWVRQSGARWGEDEDAREELGMPAYRENSWAAGLDRLLLGYAAAPDAVGDVGGLEGPYHGILPLNAVEGGTAEVLGKFLEFLRKVFHHVRVLGKSRSLEEWGRAQHAVLDDLLGDSGLTVELESLRQAIDQTARNAAQGGFHDPVSPATARQLLADMLSGLSAPGGFMTGGVTFCSMVPMRSIPFRVVCLAGMHDGAFPRTDRPGAFDLTTARPRAGDRSLRDEDRYLFLEALLSARDRLVITYKGVDPRENKPLPPSPLVRELIDYVADNFSYGQDEEGKKLSPEPYMIVRHFRQSWNAGYFTGDDRRFSYGVGDCAGAMALRKRSDPPSFVEGPLPDPAPDAPADPALDDVVAWLSHPARYFLNRRLGLRSAREVDELADAESMESPEGLERYALRQAVAGLFPDPLDHDPAPIPTEDQALAHVRALQLLPPGAPGLAVFRPQYREVAALHAALADLRGLNVALHWRAAGINAKDMLTAWAHHVRQAALGRPRHTCVAGLDGKGGAKKRWFAPVDDPGRVWNELAGWARRGLEEPLPFFPKTSWAYAEKLDESEEAARKAALGQWYAGFTGAPGEGEDGDTRLCFPDRAVLDDPFFVELAEAVAGPALGALTDDPEGAA